MENTTTTTDVLEFLQNREERYRKMIWAAEATTRHLRRVPKADQERLAYYKSVYEFIQKEKEMLYKSEAYN